MFVAIGGVVECSDDNVVLTQASAVSGGTRFEVVTTRPAAGEVGVIYLVPAANSTTENLYEEWVWIDDKWEQIGSAGLNLSNYAQLTTANTFSNANTFNGNLIKKASTTALADNSVLNRAEMDIRYGVKGIGNTWTAANTFNADTTFKSKVDIANIESNSVTIKGKEVKLNAVSAIGMLSHTINMHASYLTSIKGGNVDVTASGIATLRGKEAHVVGSSIISLTAPEVAIRYDSSNDVKLSIVGSLAAKSIHVKNVSSDIKLASGKTVLADRIEAQRIKSTLVIADEFTFDGDQFDDLTNLYYAYLSPNGIRYHSGNGAPANSTPAQFDTRGVKACMLPVEQFGNDKWGIKIDHAGCQLFGIDFSYGDVWSDTNDAIKAQGLTPMPGLDSANHFTTVKIKKPAVSIETTGIGSLSFDYATEAYIRTFPNDGGQGIFEFQAGNWTDSKADWIKRGPVDLRKASATTLGPTSVLNMEEGDIRWGGGSSAYYTGITTRKSNASAPNISTGTYPDGTAIGIGSNVKLTDNNIIAIGAELNVQTNNTPRLATMLGYQLLASGATTTRMIALGGYVANGGYIHVGNGTVCIGYTDYTQCAQEGSVVIGNNAQARSINTIAIGLEASASGMYSLACGVQAYAEAGNSMAIGGDIKVYGEHSIGIGSGVKVGNAEKPSGGSLVIGTRSSCEADQSIVIGGWTTVASNTTGQNTILGYACSATNGSSNLVAVGADVTADGSKNGIAIGASTLISGEHSMAIGHSANAMHGGLAIGPNAKINYAGILLSNIATGISLSSGDSANDTSVSFMSASNAKAANSIVFELTSKFGADQSKAVRFRSLNDAMDGEVTGYCSRNNFAQLLTNARLGNYPSQPFVEITPLHIDKLYALQPNTIYHVTIAPTIEPEPLDLSRLAFAFDITGIPTAELHIVTNSIKAISNIIWPDNTLWPDEVDQSVAPAIETPTDKTRCYVFTVRRQIINATEYLIGALAYSVDVDN
jgi:hypothetical protein